MAIDSVNYYLYVLNAKLCCFTSIASTERAAACFGESWQESDSFAGASCHATEGGIRTSLNYPHLVLHPSPHLLRSSIPGHKYLRGSHKQVRVSFVHYRRTSTPAPPILILT